MAKAPKPARRRGAARDRAKAQPDRAPSPDPTALTPEQAAELLNIPVETVRRHLAAGAP